MNLGATLGSTCSFLVARYLAICIEHSQFADIESRAFTVPIFVMAGELLATRKFSITGDFVEKTVSRGKQGLEALWQHGRDHR